jgi:hypothetical protein
MIFVSVTWRNGYHCQHINACTLLLQDVTRAELLQHCCTALQLPLPTDPALAKSTEPAAPLLQTDQQQQQQQQHTPQRLLLFNLFALECYSIAETLQVPCCVVQPYLVPYSMPSGFQRRFQRAAPGLAHLLQTSQQPPAAAAAAAEHAVSTPVSWKDVSAQQHSVPMLRYY